MNGGGRGPGSKGTVKLQQLVRHCGRFPSRRGSVRTQWEPEHSRAVLQLRPGPHHVPSLFPEPLWSQPTDSVTLKTANSPDNWKTLFGYPLKSQYLHDAKRCEWTDTSELKLLLCDSRYRPVRLKWRRLYESGKLNRILWMIRVNPTVIGQPITANTQIIRYIPQIIITRYHTVQISLLRFFHL